jgi:hypothetical protein
MISARRRRTGHGLLGLGMAVLFACAPAPRYQAATQSHCPATLAPMGCHALTLPSERPALDSTDLLCACTNNSTEHILLYKRMHPSWFTQENGDGTNNNSLIARSDALSDWVSGYFVPQNGLELRAHEPSQQGSFDLRTPWGQWQCTNGSITALLTDTLLAVRWFPDRTAYAPEMLYKDIRNE